MIARTGCGFVPAAEVWFGNRKIHVVMIVRDEAEVIGRCLESVAPLADAWTIVDTGSRDDTIAIAEAQLAGIPGRVERRLWRDFGSNRTEAVELAGDTGWLLMLDADMTIEFHADLAEWLGADPDPTVDAWLVKVEDAGTVYWLPLLLRAGLDWRYVGVTHEYLDVSNVKTRQVLGLTVTHHHDGSARETKHARDLALLERDALTGNPRALFYSAQALEHLGRTAEAVERYSDRAAAGGWEEEAWCAAYRGALLNRDVEALLSAWRRRPWRHEPLMAAAKIIASQPNPDTLFLEAM